MIKEETDRNIHVHISTWGLLCGLNDGVDDLMKIVITDFLRENYPAMPLSEVSHAFKLYAAQKLDFRDSIYNNMNPTFIGKVLISYFEHKREMNRLKAAKNNLKELPVSQVPISEERENAYKFIEKIHTKEGKFPIIANWVAAYFHLYNVGKIKTTKEEFEAEKEKVKARLEKAIRHNRSLGIRDCIEKSQLNNEMSIKGEAAKNIVQKYVRGL